jgi:hypothetical protein
MSGADVVLCQRCHERPIRGQQWSNSTLCSHCWRLEFELGRPWTHPREIEGLIARYGPSARAVAAHLPWGYFVAEGGYLDERWQDFHVELVIAPFVGSIRICRMVLVGTVAGNGTQIVNVTPHGEEVLPPQVHLTPDDPRVPFALAAQGYHVQAVLRMRLWKPGAVWFFEVYWDPHDIRLHYDAKDLPPTMSGGEFRATHELLRPAPLRGRKPDPTGAEARAQYLAELRMQYTVIQGRLRQHGERRLPHLWELADEMGLTSDGLIYKLTQLHLPHTKKALYELLEQ